MPVDLLVSAFTAGEWDPALHYRRDLEQRMNAAKRLENVLVRPQGGVQSRPPTQVIGRLPSPATTVRYHEFLQGANSPYVLEFTENPSVPGTLRIRFIYQGAYVLSTSAVDPWNQVVMAGPGTWIASATIPNAWYKAVPPVAGNPDGVYSNAQWLTRRQMAVDHALFPPGSPVVMPQGHYFWGDVDAIGAPTLYVRLHADVNPNVAAHIIAMAVTVATTYTTAVIRELSFTQNGNVLYITHPSFVVRTLTRTTHTLWTIANVVFGSGVAAWLGLTGITIGTGNVWNYRITAVSDAGEESLPVQVSWAGPPIPVPSPPSGSTLFWNGLAGIRYYNIYKEYPLFSGSYYWHGRTAGAVGVVNYTTDDVVPDTTLGAPYAATIFSAVGTYPSVSAFFQQRLLFARSTNAPDMIWASILGFPHNFNDSVPIKDTSPFAVAIASKRQPDILHLVPLNEVFVLARTEEWMLSSGNRGLSLGPRTISAAKMSENGSDPVPPVVVGTDIVTVQRGGRNLRDYRYDYESYSLSSSDLSIFASHLLEDGEKFIKISYQNSPLPVIWCVTNLGNLFSCTYFKEHGVVAWSRHTFYTTFSDNPTLCLDVEVCHDPTNTQDEIYLGMKRWINGAYQYFTERMYLRFHSGLALYGYGHTLDGSVSSLGAAVNYAYGFELFAGETIHLIADGEVLSPRVVTPGGGLWLAAEEGTAALVHGGFPFYVDVQPLELLADDSIGSTQGRVRGVSGVVAVVQNTEDLWINGYSSGIGAEERLVSEQRSIPLALADIYSTSIRVHTTLPKPVELRALIVRMQHGLYS